ncbi:CoA pyrophosphatase [Bacillaceae bacterium S4-13-56]
MEIKTIIQKVKNHSPQILGSKRISKFSVLLPLVEINEEVHILFEIRSQNLRRQPGEICFPGGKMDKEDQTTMMTAIRETTEELGISEKNITQVYPIDYLVSPFGLIIFPYVAHITDFNSMTINPEEVEEIFTVPLSYFMNKEPEIFHINLEVKPETNFPFELIPGGEEYNWRTKKIDENFYIYEGKAIWGLTAQIIKHFVEIMRGDS